MKVINNIKISCEAKEYLKLEELTEFQGDLKSRSEDDVRKISNSISKYGFSFPFFVWKHDNINSVLDGHGRLLALHRLDELGYIIPPLPVVYVNCEDEKSAKDLLLRLNSQYGKMTKESVLEFIGDYEIETDNFELPCGIIDFSDNEEPDIETDGDEEIPEIEGETVNSKRGEMYELGNSILMCGDSTDEVDVSHLMGDFHADICFTSPPYNAGLTPSELDSKKQSKYDGINSDDKTEREYTDFLNKYLQLSLEYCDYSFMNIQSLSGNKLSIIDMLYENKETFADTIIWDKIHGQPAMQENVLNSVFEYVHVFSKKANRCIGVKHFRGTIDNIVHLSKQTKNEFSSIHNATFPIEFAEFFIKNFSEKSVYEPFGGTGTTLIVAEKFGRSARVMELSPLYCDVIRKRYTKWAKENGRKITSGCLE